MEKSSGALLAFRVPLRLCRLNATRLKDLIGLVIAKLSRAGSQFHDYYSMEFFVYRKCD